VEKLLVTEGSKVIGKSPRTLDLAETKGISILAIRRQETLLVHRLADTAFSVGDLVYCIGSDQDLLNITPWFDEDKAVQEADAHG
jgi:uncharacterized protein with PhoU and TrkA domain